MRCAFCSCLPYGHTINGVKNRNPGQLLFAENFPYEEEKENSYHTQETDFGSLISRSSSPTGYLIVEANGGLNQQRSSICNAVALAGLLNVVLVIPRFSFHSVWKDPRWVTVLYFSNYHLDYAYYCQIVNRKVKRLYKNW
ncbi:hypothetical protein GIB67_001483 [Kingdonia uniflora]|uniref:O-fucosyltransferase family protein n=1 Tax=Kingdonia uniflora TaxID=39325 RepID=A0A7J7MNS9_9MAGN|nr:hypothetical protein GIB67_001483 [Kingdonia uniflora]